MKILLIGLGGWGKNHLRVWSGLQQELFVSELDTSRFSLCDLYKIDDAHRTTNYHEFLDKVDAVSIVTPTDTHFKIAKDCLEAGKDVFIEKPVCLRSDEAKELRQLVQEQKRILQVGHIFRFNPASTFIKERIDAGDVGKLRYLYGTFKGFKRARTDVGVTQTDSIHFFDLFNYFLGSVPTAVTAVTRDFMGRGLDDLSFVILEYGDIVAYIESSYFPPGTSRDITIIGEKRSLTSNITGQYVEVHKKHHALENGMWQAVDEGIEIPKITTQEPLQLELKHFLDCVEQRKEPMANITSGFNTLRIVESAYQSSKEGKRVEITYD